MFGYTIAEWRAMEKTTFINLYVMSVMAQGVYGKEAAALAAEAWADMRDAVGEPSRGNSRD